MDAYDAVVIGGGAAGLAATVTLALVRLDVRSAVSSTRDDLARRSA